MFLSFSAIALRTAAGDARMLEERGSLYDCSIFSALGFTEFCLFLLTDGFAPLAIHSFCSHLIKRFTN